MTTSRAKAIGSAAERVVARMIGGRRTYGYGPVDVQSGMFDLQVKQLSTPPSLNAIRGWLAAIPYRGDRLRGVVVLDRPGSGFATRRTITFDLAEFAEWYGRVDSDAR